MDRGHNYKYLNGALALEKFEETDPPICLKINFNDLGYNCYIQ